MKQLLLLCNLLFAIASVAQPTITTFNPTSGAIGSTVIISGTGFNPVDSQNVVFFGATQATVNSASTTTLNVSVPVGATYEYLTVTNLANNLTVASDQPFITTFSGGHIAFAPRENFPMSSNPQALRLGDMDGDGQTDLVLAKRTTRTSILRNTSTAGMLSMAGQADFTTAGNSLSGNIGDLDGDGKLDIVTTNYFDDNISVLRNTSTVGMLSFASKIDYNTGIEPSSVAIGDLDGDGKPELIITNYSSSFISVFRNTSTVGNISFAPKVDFPTAFAAGNQAVRIGDIDGDGKPDLVVAEYRDDRISIFRNTSTLGTISMAPRVLFLTPGTPYSLKIGDLDNDGKPDIAVANRFENSFSVFKNTSTSGSITLATRMDIATGQSPYSLAMGDVDGDGKLEIVVTNSLDREVSVFKNTTTNMGPISFAPRVSFQTHFNPFSVRIGDIDGDNKPDLAVASSSLSSLVSVFRQIIPPPPTVNAFSPAAGCANETTVLISGTDFTGATDVLFDSVSALNFTVLNPFQISATVGAGTTGTITVVTGGGTGSSTDTFTVHPTPMIDLGADTSHCGTFLLDLSIATGSSYLWSTGDTTPNLAIMVSDTYAVMVSDTNGCSTTDTIIVNINPLPTVSLGADTTQCAGSVLLDANVAGLNYLWSTGDTTQTIAATASNTYAIVVTDTNNCSATDTINVTINPLPNTSTTLSGIILSANQNAATYQWVDCNADSMITGATNQSYTPTVNGDYAVIVDLNACIDTSACVTVIVVSTASIAPNKSTFSIYPNPSTTTSNFVLESLSSTASFVIYNSLGQVVQVIPSVTNKITVFDRTNLTSGLYWVHLMDNGQLVDLQKLLLVD